MNFVTYKTPMTYYPAVKDFLHQQEVINGLTIGLLLRAKPETDYSKCFYCAGMVDGQVKISFMIHGLHLVLAADSQTYIKETAAYIYALDLDYPGILGPRPYVDQLVEALNAYRDQEIPLHMSQRIYRLDHVNDLDISQGHMRFAEQEDLDILMDWNMDFALMIGDGATLDHLRAARLEDIENHKLFVWEVDHQPTTMTSLSRSTGGGVNISLVYTPKEHRNKGYATSLVAKVSEYALKSYDYCTLYTDLGNPTSNSIYMKIGYYPVVDSALYLL